MDAPLRAAVLEADTMRSTGLAVLIPAVASQAARAATGLLTATDPRVLAVADEVRIQAEAVLRASSAHEKAGH